MTDAGAVPFELEPSPPAGTVPPRVLDGLRAAHRAAADYAQAFGEAVAAAAAKHGVNPRALRRYVVALESDKVESAGAEAADLIALIETEES